jgi:peptidoglycan/LPS O-acetylase OafA/YrhL
MVSAFTLALSYNSRSQKEEHPTKNFFIRRFFRIYPLFIFTCLLIFIINRIIPYKDFLSLDNLFLHLTFLY